MIYQLPNGKTIYLSIDEYLNLTDSDIQYMVANNYGEVTINPFSGSAVDLNAKERTYDFSDYHNDDDTENDTDIDLNDLEGK